MADFFGGNLTETKSTDTTEQDTHFNQGKKRDIEFIKIPNKLRQKVGSGGLDQKILERAQSVIDNNSFDFTPDAQRHLTAIREGLRLIQTQRHRFDADALIATIAEPSIQLRANGAIFGYPMVTRVSDLFIRFLETLSGLDDDSLEVINGFNAALNAVIVGQIRQGNEDSEKLYEALEQACDRYFEKIQN
jgi:hypothetical protein